MHIKLFLCVRYNVRIKVYIFQSGYIIFPLLNVKIIFFPHWITLHLCSESIIICVWVYFGLYSIPFLSGYCCANTILSWLLQLHSEPWNQGQSALRIFGLQSFGFTKCGWKILEKNCVHWTCTDFFLWFSNNTV